MYVLWGTHLEAGSHVAHTSATKSVAYDLTSRIGPVLPQAISPESLLRRDEEDTGHMRHPSPCVRNHTARTAFNCHDESPITDPSSKKVPDIRKRTDQMPSFLCYTI